MKIVLFSAAAIAMVAATPALAAVNPDRDGAGTYVITGTADNYCELGPIAGDVGQSGGHNTTVNISDNSGDYDFSTSDATIVINQLQTDNNDHAKAWKAVLNMRRSICNTPYTVTANSTNGGLKYQGAVTGDFSFTTSLPYTVHVQFGGQEGHKKAHNIQNIDYALITSPTASSGDFKLTFDGAADDSQYLLSGDYSDTVLVKLTANLGTTL